MKRCLVSLTFLFFALIINAQKEYFEGYVMLTSQDTLFGYIMNNNYVDNSKKCEFKKTVDGEVTEYSPDQIFGYRFKDGKFYITKELDGEKKFYEFLIQGKLNMYYLQYPDISNHYYIEKEDLPLKEILFKSEIVVDGEGIQRIIRSKYPNQLLSYYTSDAPALKSTAMSFEKPHSATLIKFAKRYHNTVCTDEACTIFEKKRRMEFEFEVFSGWDYTPTNNKLKIPSHSSFSEGCRLHIMIPQASEYLYFGIGLNIDYEYPVIEHTSTYQVGVDLYGNPVYATVYAMDYKKMIQVPLSITYNNHRNGFSPIYGAHIDLMHMFDFGAIGGVNYQKKALGLKAYLDLSAFSFNSGFALYTGVKVGASYRLFKK